MSKDTKAKPFRPKRVSRLAWKLTAIGFIRIWPMILLIAAVVTLYLKPEWIPLWAL
ncbi:hypothetical protein HOH87_07055 [bacterium]|jgi:hypothetical protein|nr:hypothetical protein [bacterium]